MNITINVKSFVLGSGLAVATMGVIAFAVNIPNTFAAGEVISAAKMNANFEALKSANDALEARTATLEAFKNGLASARGSVWAYAVVNGIPSAQGIKNQFVANGGTITLSRTALGRYELTIPNKSIFIQNTPVLITAVGGNSCNYNSVSGKLLVDCRDLAGADVDTVFVAVVLNE